MSNFNLTYQKDGENEQLYYKDAHNNDLYIRSCEDFAPAIIQEKSGNPIAITDGADCPIRKLKVIFEPIQSGTGVPSPDNIRPITGRTAVTVERTGKNLLNPAFSAFDLAGTYRAQKMPDTGFTLSIKDKGNGADISGIYFGITEYGINANGYVAWLIQNGTIKSTEKYTPTYRYVTIYPTGQATLNKLLARFDVQVEFNTTATDYEPYDGQSVTVQLGQTVYGGTVDVTAGTMTVEWENIASYDGEALPGEWISDRDAYAPGTTPTTGAQVCYKLATPTEIITDPATLSTLKGENTFSTDGTSIELEYVVDTKTYIDNLFNSGTKTVVKPNDEIKIIDENKGVE